MGGVIDTSVFIAAERRAITTPQLFSHLLELAKDDVLVISSITAVELVQGCHQGDPFRAARRKLIVDEVLRATPILPFTEVTARLAGQLRGERAASGNALPFADSLIAATALEKTFSVVTTNLKDFTRIPGLKVIPFTT